MGKIARLIWIDEFIWTQFQALYPRQASKFIENSLKESINIKLDFADEEINELRRQTEENRKAMDSIKEQNTIINSKIQAWEAKKREELLEQKRREEEEDELAKAELDTLRYSGALEDAL